MQYLVLFAAMQETPLTLMISYLLWLQLRNVIYVAIFSKLDIFSHSVTHSIEAYYSTIIITINDLNTIYISVFSLLNFKRTQLCLDIVILKFKSSTFFSARKFYNMKVERQFKIEFSK